MDNNRLAFPRKKQLFNREYVSRLEETSTTNNLDRYVQGSLPRLAEGDPYRELGVVEIADAIHTIIGGSFRRAYRCHDLLLLTLAVADESRDRGPLRHGRCEHLRTRRAPCGKVSP